MKLDISGMPAEQKDKIKKIVTLGQQFGGTEEIDNYLMEELMNAYMPQEQAAPEVDKNLLDIYKATKNEKVGTELVNDYFSKTGRSTESTGAVEGGIDQETMDAILKAYEEEGGSLSQANPNIIQPGQQTLGSQYIS